MLHEITRQNIFNFPYLKGTSLKEYLSLSPEEIKIFQLSRIEYLLSKLPSVKREKGRIYTKEDHGINSIFNLSKRKQIDFSTSGTTGTPLGFQLDSVFCLYRNSYIIQKILIITISIYETCFY